MSKRNVTLSVEESLLHESRDFAKEHGMSLNDLIRRLLQEAIGKADQSWVDAWIARIKAAPPIKSNWKWNRSELYED